MLMRALVIAVGSITTITAPRVPAGSDGTTPSVRVSVVADFPSTTMTDSTYQTMLGAKGVQVVYAHAIWSGSVHQMDPAIASLSFKPSQFTLWRLDVDQCPKATAAFKIANVPTVIIFRDGKEVKRFSGGKPKSALEEFIRSALP